MIQKDYYLRMIEEFGHALANFMERRHDAARRDREMADLYRQYVGDYTLVRNLSVEETMVYAHDQWADDERIGRLGMLAELLYAEATYCAVPISTLLYDKAYRLYDYVETHGDTYSIDRHNKMEAIRRILKDKG